MPLLAEAPDTPPDALTVPPLSVKALLSNLSPTLCPPEEEPPAAVTVPEFTVNGRVRVYIP
jgi:hypothetical protein